MKKVVLTSVASIVAVTSLSGCTVSRSADAGIKQQSQMMNPLVQKARAPLPSKEFNRIKESDDLYIGGVSRRNLSGQALPAEYEDKVIFRSAAPMSLFEVGTFVAEATGLPVVYAPEILEDRQFRGSQRDATGAQNVTLPGQVDMSGRIGRQALEVGAISDLSSTVEKLRLNHTGSLTDLLDRVSGHFNVAWQWDGERIRFYKLISRTYRIAALASDLAVNTTLNAGLSQSGDNGQAGASQSAVDKLQVDMWKDFQNALNTIVPANDAEFSISESTGSVTVTATYDIIERVEEFVNDMNEQLSQQVVVSVEIYDVILQSNENYDFSMQALWNNAKTAVQGGALAPFDPNNLAFQFLPITPSAGRNGFGVGIIDPQSDFSGSNGFIQALSSQADISVVTSASVTTMNGVPAPLQVSNTRDYISSVSSLVNNGVSQTTVETKTLNSGFSLNVLPMVMDDGDVILKYSINLSELAGSSDGFDVAKIDNNTLQLANVNQRSFIQQTQIPTGTTLVLAGFEEVRNRSQKSGQGSPMLPILGGGRAATKERSSTVIMITPRVMDAKKLIESVAE